MPKRVFVSYSHKQGDWVWDRLVPVLKAGGAEPLVDRERFKLGRALFDQMDALQDEADVQLLCLSEDYLASPACCHEMERAVALDPDFKKNVVVPVKVAEVDLPPAIGSANPLYADLRGGRISAAWDLVLAACDADLGTTAPRWLEARDEVRTLLGRNQGVNLVVQGNANWAGLIEHLREELHLPEVDLESGATETREGLMRAILRALEVKLPAATDELSLETFEGLIDRLEPKRLALTHFHYAAHRPGSYDWNLFGSLRHLTMTRRKLILLVQSRQPYMSILPAGHPLSEISLHQVPLDSR